MRPEESMRDLSILVSAPTVIVAIMTVIRQWDGWAKQRSRKGLTESDNHGALNIVRYEGYLEPT